MQYAAKDSVLIPCYPLCLYFILCCLLFTAYFGFAIRCELLLYEILAMEDMKFYNKNLHEIRRWTEKT